MTNVCTVCHFCGVCSASWSTRRGRSLASQPRMFHPSLPRSLARLSHRRRLFLSRVHPPRHWAYVHGPSSSPQCALHYESYCLSTFPASILSGVNETRGSRRKKRDNAPRKLSGGECSGRSESYLYRVHSAFHIYGPKMASPKGHGMEPWLKCDRESSIFETRSSPPETQIYEPGLLKEGTHRV